MRRRHCAASRGTAAISSSASPPARFRSVPLNLPLLKGYSIVGVYWGGFVQREPAANAANMKQLMDWVATGKLAPLDLGALPAVADAVDALFAMMRREVAGKVVIVPY